ncbi:hypothetical protein TNCT_669801 [Trichonephila clavata]|uniref:Uncharacterized protein n=1 Tax=Trichonephila clavata TaxID=2740835 RepID=A0A8X6K774_TRICU|nr:hypothetical protein TNCT_669801 [Trichonephila clavata]
MTRPGFESDWRTISAGMYCCAKTECAFVSWDCFSWYGGLCHNTCYLNPKSLDYSECEIHQYLTGSRRLKCMAQNPDLNPN